MKTIRELEFELTLENINRKRSNHKKRYKKLRIIKQKANAENGIFLHEQILFTRNE